MTSERYNHEKVYDYHNLFSGLKICSHRQVQEVLLHFIVVSGLFKEMEAKKISILEKCLVLSLNVVTVQYILHWKVTQNVKKSYSLTWVYERFPYKAVFLRFDFNGS